MPIMLTASMSAQNQGTACQDTVETAHRWYTVGLFNIKTRKRLSQGNAERKKKYRSVQTSKMAEVDHAEEAAEREISPEQVSLFWYY